jgi:hypothetical protein
VDSALLESLDFASNSGINVLEGSYQNESIQDACQKFDTIKGIHWGATYWGIVAGASSFVEDVNGAASTETGSGPV